MKYTQLLGETDPRCSVLHGRIFFVTLGLEIEAKDCMTAHFGMEGKLWNLLELSLQVPPVPPDHHEAEPSVA